MVLFGNIGAPPTITVAAKAGVAMARAVTSASVFRVLRVDMIFLLRCGFSSISDLSDETLPSNLGPGAGPHPSHRQYGRSPPADAACDHKAVTAEAVTAWLARGKRMSAPAPS